MSSQAKLQREADVDIVLSPAVAELQNQLLELVSQGVALLNCFSPPLGALLTEDGLAASIDYQSIIVGI